MVAYIPFHNVVGGVSQDFRLPWPSQWLDDKVSSQRGTLSCNSESSYIAALPIVCDSLAKFAQCGRLFVTLRQISAAGKTVIHSDTTADTVLVCKKWLPRSDWIMNEMCNKSPRIASIQSLVLVRYAPVIWGGVRSFHIVLPSTDVVSEPDINLRWEWAVRIRNILRDSACWSSRQT